MAFAVLRAFRFSNISDTTIEVYFTGDDPSHVLGVTQSSQVGKQILDKILEFQQIPVCSIEVDIEDKRVTKIHKINFDFDAPPI